MANQFNQNIQIAVNNPERFFASTHPPGVFC
jgi:hypothetical protein